jgi:hypothetical protein
MPVETATIPAAGQPVLPDSALETAAALLVAVKSGADPVLVGALEAALSAWDRDALTTELNNDAKKKAFWINVYNALIQLRLPEAGALSESLLRTLLFFRSKRMVVAGVSLAFDDIEHGILRRSRTWWSAGYVRKPWASGWERRWRVDRLDPRIHFALNCGAVSCPPIRHYDAEGIDAQLDLATAAYLEGTVIENTASGELHVPGILNMFRGDFGGRKGIMAFISQHGKYRDASSGLRLRFDAFQRASRLHYYA